MTPSPLSYLAWLHATAAQTPDRSALIDRTLRLSYGELSDAIRAVASATLEAGFEPGKPVGLAFDPSIAYVVLALGLMEAGAVPAFINTRLAPVEVGAYLETIRPQAVVHHPDYAALFGDRDERRIAVAAGDPGSIGNQLKPFFGDPTARPAPAESAPALIFPTGGTTGLPKGCYTSHRQLLLWAWNIATTNQRHRDETELFVAPFFHVSLVVGVLAPLFARGTVVIEPAFNPVVALETIRQHRVTRLMGAPTVLTSLIRAAEGDYAAFEGIRDIGFGAASWTDEFCDSLTTAFPNAEITAGYGATEFASGVSRIAPADFRSGRYAGAGVANPGCEIAIFDANRNRLPQGETGEIGVRSPWQTVGYWNRPDETAAVYDDDGFIRLGDIGYLEDDGWLHVAGRLKEMIITGGENVFPLEVEQGLTKVRGVDAAVAFGVPDSHWGQRVEAVVTAAAGVTLDAAAIREQLRTHIAGYKIPKAVHVVAAIPTTANGKPDRTSLTRTYGRATS